MGSKTDMVPALPELKGQQTVNKDANECVISNYVRNQL